jgi:hypothetical protein
VHIVHLARPIGDRVIGILYHRLAIWCPPNIEILPRVPPKKKLTRVCELGNLLMFDGYLLIVSLPGRCRNVLDQYVGQVRCWLKPGQDG